MDKTGYIKTAKTIMAGRLERPTLAVSPSAWATAQGVVGRALGASNETYMATPLLVGLCTQIAEAIDETVAAKLAQRPRASKRVTRKRVSKVWMGLQTAAFMPGVPKRGRTKVRDAMDVLNEIAMDMRREAIYDAGARTKKLGGGVPKFEGRELGSAEAFTFYDGYASTHPGFKHPYRRTW